MTPDSIRAHQNGIYTVCLHVLKHPQDAEDAAQEALIKVAAEAGRLREPRALKSWLYRVTFRTAVDHLRKRATRRRIEEGSVPMPPSLTDEQREAIHEAMAALPDDDRLLLVEHYFEKATLEEMGRREGLSDVAMGKRVEKARERLKRGLAGAGILLGASQVSHALESVTAAPAPVGLVGPALTSKAMSVATLVGAGLVLLITVGVAYRILNPRESTRVATNRDSTQPPPGSLEPAAKAVRSDPFDLVTAKGDRQACRGILSRMLPGMRWNDMAHYAWLFACGSDRGSPEINKFVKDFTASAGDDLLPISKEILAESPSDTLKFLLIVALGRSGNPQALELLKQLAGAESGIHVAASAIHSIGLIRSAGSLDFLRAAMGRAQESNKAMMMPILVAIGRQGPAGLDLLLAEARKSDGLSYQGVPWSFSLGKGDCLAYAQGEDLFEGLRKILETEVDPEVREGAAGAMARNLRPGHVDVLAGFLSKFPDTSVKRTVVYSLVAAREDPALWESTRIPRVELADRILSETPFPSGDPLLDRALIHLGSIASVEKSDALFERFMALYSQSRAVELSFSVGEVIAAYAERPDSQAKVSALLESTQLSEEQRGFVTLMAFQKGTPEIAATLITPVLEIVRKSRPGELRFENGLSAIVFGIRDERVLSEALVEMYDRLPQDSDRSHVLQRLVSYTDRTGAATAPRTFYERVIRSAPDVKTLFTAAQGLFASPGDLSSDPVLRGRVAEWIGRDMKWITQSGEDDDLSGTAPEVIGDFYSRFGTPSDVEWLRKLPDSIPYPGNWTARERKWVQDELLQETKRAIDAIRLRN